MAEKWISMCRDCGAVFRGKFYECACGSKQVRQRDIGPLFPEDVERMLEESPEMARIKENEG